LNQGNLLVRGSNGPSHLTVQPTNGFNDQSTSALSITSGLSKKPDHTWPESRLEVNGGQKSMVELQAGPFSAALHMDHQNNLLQYVIDTVDRFHVNTQTSAAQISTLFEVYNDASVALDITAVSDIAVSGASAEAYIKSDSSAANVIIQGGSSHLIQMTTQGSSDMLAIRYDHTADLVSLRMHTGHGDAEHDGSTDSELSISTTSSHAVSISDSLDMVGNVTGESISTAVLGGSQASVTVEGAATEMSITSDSTAFLKLNEPSASRRVFQWANDGDLALVSSENNLEWSNLLTMSPMGNVVLNTSLSIPGAVTAQQGMNIVGVAIGTCTVESANSDAQLVVESSASGSLLQVASEVSATLAMGTVADPDTFTWVVSDQQLAVNDLWRVEADGDVNFLRSTSVFWSGNTGVHIRGQDSATVDVVANEARYSSGASASSVVTVQSAIGELSSLQMIAGSQNFSWWAGPQKLELLNDGLPKLTFDAGGNMTVAGMLAVDDNLNVKGDMTVDSLDIGDVTPQIECKKGMMDTAQVGDAVFSSDTKHCYFRSIVRAGFAAAAASCEQWGAHLATVSSRSENDLLKGLLITGEAAYIGLSDAGALTSFRWINGEFGPYEGVGTIAVEHGTYYHGGGRQDNTHTKHCVVMTHDGSWNLADCDHSEFFVCEHRF